MRWLLNVEQEVQFFFKLGGAEGDLNLRYYLHLNVNSCILLCLFKKLESKCSNNNLYIYFFLL